jgi:hypothetical protein
MYVCMCVCVYVCMCVCVYVCMCVCVYVCMCVCVYDNVCVCTAVSSAQLRSFQTIIMHICSTLHVLFFSIYVNTIIIHHAADLCMHGCVLGGCAAGWTLAWAVPHFRGDDQITASRQLSYMPHIISFNLIATYHPARTSKIEDHHAGLLGKAAPQLHAS